MPRFSILAHDWPHPHLDLLLDSGPALRAWRLPADPTPGVWLPAEPNADHRRVYLDYEGPVGGGRGTVTRWAAGTVTAEADGWVLDWDGGSAELRPAGDGWRFRLTG